MMLLLLLFFAIELYGYAAMPYHVVDGDTVDAIIDTGFHQRRDERIRIIWYDDLAAAPCGYDARCRQRAIVGVDTPELNARDLTVRSRAQDAKAYVETWLAYHATLNTHTLDWGGQETAYFVVRTELIDSFGRPLGDIRDQQGNSLGRDLLDSGHAVVWNP
jgi:endonuclease YncB( thermonuclease family)